MNVLHEFQKYNIVHLNLSLENILYFEDGKFKVSDWIYADDIFDVVGSKSSRERVG